MRGVAASHESFVARMRRSGEGVIVNALGQCVNETPATEHRRKAGFVDGRRGWLRLRCSCWTNRVLQTFVTVMLRSADYCSAQLIKSSAVARNAGRYDRFFQHFCGVLSGILLLSSCRRISLPSYCCSAVSRSFIARPPPFLGVSSLNLAALTSGHFFCPSLLRREFVAGSLM